MPDDLHDEIAPAPDLRIAPGDEPQLQAHTYRGRIIGYTVYRVETCSGGVYLAAQHMWLAWGPVTPSDFQKLAAECLNTAALQADERHAEAN